MRSSLHPAFWQPRNAREAWTRDSLRDFFTCFRHLGSFSRGEHLPQFPGLLT